MALETETTTTEETEPTVSQEEVSIQNRETVERLLHQQERNAMMKGILLAMARRFFLFLSFR